MRRRGDPGTGNASMIARYLQQQHINRTRERLQDLFGEDSEASQESNNYNYSPPSSPPRQNQIAGFHIGHPHRHPGHYTDHDEHHRHRKRDRQPKTEMVRSYRRRTNLF